MGTKLFWRKNETKAHFLEGFADLWLCGLWPIVCKKYMLVDLAHCLFSVRTLAWFQLHHAVKPGTAKQVNGKLDCWYERCQRLWSYLGCGPRLSPRAFHASWTGISSASSSWLWPYTNHWIIHKTTHTIAELMKAWYKTAHPLFTLARLLSGGSSSSSSSLWSSLLDLLFTGCPLPSFNRVEDCCVLPSEKTFFFS